MSSVFLKSTTKAKLTTRIAMRIIVGMGRKSLRRLEASSHRPIEDNESLLFSILKRNKDTEFGRLHGFASIHSIEDYRRKVPLSTYDYFKPYIDRIYNGGENLLYKDRTMGFSRTSGTSGSPKIIPATLFVCRADFLAGLKTHARKRQGYAPKSPKTLRRDIREVMSKIKKVKTFSRILLMQQWRLNLLCCSIWIYARDAYRCCTQYT